jgi:copper chaperone CopZ
MRIIAFVCLLISQSFAPLIAGEKDRPKASPTTLTFFITGIECAACVEMVRQSVSNTPGVVDLFVEQRIDSYASVAFDPQQVSAHQIAQAIFDSMPLHGRPYEPRLMLTIPAYTKPEIAAKVDAAVAKHKASIEVEVMDKAKGELLLYFLPLKCDPTNKKPQGWNHMPLLHALQDPAPKGLGLDVKVLSEGLDMLNLPSKAPSQ